MKFFSESWKRIRRAPEESEIDVPAHASAHPGFDIADPRPNPEEALIAAQEHQGESEEDEPNPIPFSLRMSAALHENPFPSAGRIDTDAAAVSDEHSDQESSVIEQAYDKRLEREELMRSLELGRTVPPLPKRNAGRKPEGKHQKGAETIRRDLI
jgi:hypothetical protein